MKHKKKVLALILTLALLVTGLTTTAFASGIGGDAGINLVSPFSPVYNMTKNGLAITGYFYANPIRPYIGTEEDYFVGVKHVLAAYWPEGVDGITTAAQYSAPTGSDYYDTATGFTYYDSFDFDGYLLGIEIGEICWYFNRTEYEHTAFFD